MKKITLFACILAIPLLFNACKKDVFDAPPTVCQDPTGITVTHSIAELKAMYSGTGFLEITDDIIISGVVNADDREGNVYKTIILQDDTAGISIKVDRYDLYVDYPVGRKIFIKCKGMYLGNYNGLVQLGGGIDYSASPASLAYVPSSLVSNYIIKGSCNNTVNAKILPIGSLYNAYQNMLVQLDDVEFASSSLGQTYANAVTGSSANLTVEDCSGAFITLRTSGYSSFAGKTIPTGKGKMYAIFQVFGSTLQLLIRDTTDVRFTDPRCGAVTTPLTSLAEQFNTVTINSAISTAGWQTYAVQGGVSWKGKSFSGNYFAEATAYASGAPAVESWLVSPPLNMDVVSTLAFESAMSYWVHDGLSVYISTDFDGTNVATATWTDISSSCTLANGSSSNYTWIHSGSVDIAPFTGTGYIGFKYVGGDPGMTTNYRIDSVFVN